MTQVQIKSDEEVSLFVCIAVLPNLSVMMYKSAVGLLPVLTVAQGFLPTSFDQIFGQPVSQQSVLGSQIDTGDD